MKKEKTQKSSQGKSKRQGVRAAHGGFRPGPWPNGGPPKIRNEPYPGQAPEGWTPDEES